MQVFEGEETLERQSGVEREGGVAFGEHEAVALRIIGTGDMQDIRIEDGDDLGDRKGRRYVADMRPFGFFEYDTAQ